MLSSGLNNNTLVTKQQSYRRATERAISDCTARGKMSLYIIINLQHRLLSLCSTLIYIHPFPSCQQTYPLPPFPTTNINNLYLYSTVNDLTNNSAGFPFKSFKQYKFIDIKIGFWILPSWEITKIFSQNFFLVLWHKF